MIITGYIIWSVILFVIGFFYLYIYLFKNREIKLLAMIIFYFGWCYALFASRHNIDRSFINILILSILFSLIIFLMHRNMYQHH